jgi:hypothetical protein
MILLSLFSFLTHVSYLVTKSVSNHHHDKEKIETFPEEQQQHLPLITDHSFSTFLKNLLSRHFSHVHQDETTGHFHISLDYQSATIDTDSLEVCCQDKDLKKRIETLITRALSCLEPL